MLGLPYWEKVGWEQVMKFWSEDQPFPWWWTFSRLPTLSGFKFLLV